MLGHQEDARGAAQRQEPAVGRGAAAQTQDFTLRVSQRWPSSHHGHPRPPEQASLSPVCWPRATPSPDKEGENCHPGTLLPRCVTNKLLGFEREDERVFWGSLELRAAWGGTMLRGRGPGRWAALSPNSAGAAGGQTRLQTSSKGKSRCTPAPTSFSLSQMKTSDQGHYRCFEMFY